MKSFTKLSTVHDAVVFNKPAALTGKESDNCCLLLWRLVLTLL